MTEKNEKVVQIRFNFVKVFFEIVARLVLVLLLLKTSNAEIDPVLATMVGGLLMVWAVIPLLYGVREVYIERKIYDKLQRRLKK